MVNNDEMCTAMMLLFSQQNTADSEDMLQLLSHKILLLKNNDNDNTLY